MDKSHRIIFDIIPLDETTARLRGIDIDSSNEGIFRKLGKYEGHGNYLSDDEINVLTYHIGNIEYLITEIQGCTFSHCHNVKVIKIGEAVRNISWNMYQCNSLIDIFVDKNNKVFHDINGVLYKGKTLLGFPSGRTGTYHVPDGTKRLHNCSFKTSKISQIILPNSLEEIGTNVFYECKNLTEIILPHSIKKVESNNNRDSIPITQTFYLAEDVNRENPLKIGDVIKMFSK